MKSKSILYIGIIGLGAYFLLKNKFKSFNVNSPLKDTSTGSFNGLDFNSTGNKQVDKTLIRNTPKIARIKAREKVKIARIKSRNNKHKNLKTNNNILRNKYVSGKYKPVHQIKKGNKFLKKTLKVTKFILTPNPYMSIKIGSRIGKKLINKWKKRHHKKW